MQHRTETVPANQVTSISTSKRTQLLSAAILGIVIIFAVGMMPVDVVHNAAHDTRHSFTFPCH